MTGVPLRASLAEEREYSPVESSRATGTTCTGEGQGYTGQGPELPQVVPGWPRQANLPQVVSRNGPDKLACHRLCPGLAQTS